MGTSVFCLLLLRTEQHKTGAWGGWVGVIVCFKFRTWGSSAAVWPLLNLLYCIEIQGKIGITKCVNVSVRIPQQVSVVTGASCQGRPGGWPGGCTHNPARPALFLWEWAGDSENPSVVRVREWALQTPGKPLASPLKPSCILTAQGTGLAPGQRPTPSWAADQRPELAVA